MSASLWIATGVAAVVVVVVVLASLATLDDAARRRRTRRRRRPPPRGGGPRLEAEGPDAVESWLEPIPMVWPTRAPRNGHPFDDDPGREETTA
jgi:hypothetical protein